MSTSNLHLLDVTLNARAIIYIYVRCPCLCVTCQLQICLDLDHGEFIIEETKGFIDKMNHECGKVSNEVALPHHLVFAGKTERERKKQKHLILNVSFSDCIFKSFSKSFNIY